MPTSRAYEYVMGFVSSSEDYRRQYHELWREVLANYMVHAEWQTTGKETSPYRYGSVYRTRKNNIILKDPETHKLVQTYQAKIMRALFSDPKREYIQARPVGYEDAPTKAPTATRLLRYVFGLPGVYRSNQEAILEMLLFGTSIVEVGYLYEQREMLVRTVESQLGVETELSERMIVPVYDDVVITPISVNDFFPDPSRYRMQDMTGAAKRFRMNGFEAMRRAASGIYSQNAVNKAIERGAGRSDKAHDDFRQGLDQPMDTEPLSEFKEMIGYEYWGEVPWEEEGISRRVITVLNGQVVRDAPYPLSDPFLPFHSFIINPVPGRFYGIGPAEVMRWDQSFADAVKILLAEAIIRQVHPPIAVDPDAEPDLAALRDWRADTIVTARGGPNAVGTVRYEANISAAFNMLAGLKREIQEGSGATGGIQGEPGPDREAASVGVQRIQMALDRPELVARLIEEDTLPCIGKAVLRRYQQFTTGTEDLARRIGELPEGAWIGDIMGDFDVSFSGSRSMISRQQKLQAYDRLVALASAIPTLQAQIPWQEIGRDLIGEVLELPEIAARMAAGTDLAANLQMMQLLGAGGGRGSPMASEPTGMLPQQAAGGEIPT